jgi:hypothetical protein
MDEQFDLWSDNGDDKAEHLERVSSRIARAILDYCRDHPQFHADDLRRAVTRTTGCAAPGSADRVLRRLRQQGMIDYVCLSRSESLYEVFRVGQPNGELRADQ